MSAFAHSPRGGQDPPRRRAPQRISGTTRPTVEADAELWPWWTEYELEDIPFEAFDDDGNLVREIAPVSGRAGR